MRSPDGIELNDRSQASLPAAQFAVRSQPLAGNISVCGPTGPGEF